MNLKNAMERWTVEDSADLYQIREWGAGYFSISDGGDVVVTPLRDKNHVSVNLPEIIAGIKARGYDMPMLLRFEDILDSQITRMHESFRSAIARFDYKGDFKGVYPIKVNQQKQVIETIARIGKNYHHGLEAGSKAELIAALSFLEDKESCLICNGYKDREFIDLGLYAIKMGFKCFFVLEKPGELDLILERSQRLGIKPLLGVRFKLSTLGGGHWTESGGIGVFLGSPSPKSSNPLKSSKPRVCSTACNSFTTIWDPRSRISGISARPSRKPVGFMWGW